MATEAVIIQEPISMEKMATEAVIIQEPISVVVKEKLAAEAVIIAEPISTVKTEGESKHLTFEVSTNNNGVETEKIVSEGNPGISKGESFLISPEISMVANETTKMLEHIEVDGSAFTAEKIPEDGEKMVIRNEEKAGTQDGTRKDDINDGGEEIKERCSMDPHDPIVEGLKDANETVSEAGNSDRVQEDTEPEKLPAEVGMDTIISDSIGDTLARRVAESEETACIHEPEVDEKLEEVSSEEIKCMNGDNDGIQDDDLFDTSSVMKTKELHSQASGIGTENALEECLTEETRQNEIDEKTDQDFGMSGELSNDCANSELENVVVDMIQVAYKEPAMMDASNEMKRDEESAVAAPEGDIIEAGHVSILDEKPASPMNVVYKDVDTANSGETAVTSASVEATAFSKDREEISDGEGRETMVVEEASNSNVEETAKADKDPSPSDVKESKKEIIPAELKEELVRSSSFELEEYGKDTEEETSAKKDEAEGEKNEINNNVVAIEEISIATTEHEGVRVEGANIDVNSSISSVTCEKNVETLAREGEGRQAEILNAGNEDQMEMTTNEIPLKEVLGDEVKEHSSAPSEEYETIEERKLTETSEKVQDPYEHSEKVAVDVKVVQEIDMELAVTEAVDEIKTHLEYNVPIPEGSITEAGNADLVEESREEIPESFQQTNEPENKKSARPLNVVSEDVDTAICGETVETSTIIEEATSIQDHKERSEGEGREDSPAHHLQVEVNEKKETVEVEITNQNADDLQVIDSSVGQPAENKQGMQFELSDVLSEEQIHEAVSPSKEKEEDSEDVSEACKSSDSTNPEHIFTEAAATTDSKPETSEIDNENIEDNSKHEETKEVGEKLESDNTVESAEKRILEDEDTKYQTTLKEVLGSQTAALGTEEEEEKKLVEEELVHNSSLELEESKKDTEEETTVKESIETADLDCTSKAAELEETNLKENATTMPSEEYEGTLIEETIVVDGTLEEDQALHKHSEDVVVDVQPVENEALEHREEGIMHEFEDCSAEKPEPRDAVENIKDSSKLEETNEVLEDPKSIIKEAYGIIDDSLKSTEIMKEESKEENTAAMASMTETSNSIIEEKASIEGTAKSDNDPSLFDVAKELKEEITTIEVKEDHVHSSSFELVESRNFIEEEISVAEMEETNFVVETTADTRLEQEEEHLQLDDGRRDATVKDIEKTNKEEIIGDEIEEDAKDAKTTFEICSQTERSIELEAVAEDEMEASETLTKKISDEEVQNPTSALPSKEEECESTITAEMIESGKTTDDKGEDASLHKDCLREDEDLAVYDSASSQVNPTEKLKGLPNPVDTLPTDHLHLTTSMLSSEVQGDETMETELKGDDIPEKIPEQTWEIEEASDLNTEIHEKDFDNELLDGKEDDAIQEKPVKAGTETGKIIPNEVSTEKVIMEAQKTSESENPIEDQTVEDPGQASVGRIETTAVEEENVELALAGLEEKPKSDLEPVAEDRSKKTIAEHTESQDVETGIDIQYQETEEPIKEEPKDKLEAEDSICGEESANEVIKAAILSDVVDKEVEKADGIEDIKEQVMEEESGTNELHPISKGNEATDEVEDYSGVSTECVEEVKSEEQIDLIGSPNSVLEVKPEEQIQTFACTLLSEDEHIRTANPVEKIEEEKQKDAEIKCDSREVPSETKTVEEACLSNEGQKELKAVSEEETIADQGPLNDEPEEQIQITSSTLHSGDSEHGTRSISEEIEYGKTKEEVPTKLDIVTGDEVTGEQTLSDYKPEEDATSPPLISKEDGEENIHTVEKTEEKKIYEADMIADKIEEFSFVERTTEVCLEKEELPELDDGKKDDAEKEDEKTTEAEIIRDEIGEDAKNAKTTLEICSQTERSVVLEAVAEDEMTASETLAETISDEEVQNLASALPSKEEKSESTTRAEMMEAVAVDENASSLTEKPEDLLKPVDILPTDHLHLTTSVLPSEVQGDESKETELKEDESPEKIPEQTREIEEALDHNTEIHEKAIDNELPDETEDSAIQEKLVKAETETAEIILDEVSTEKVIMESQKTSENENPIKDESVEDLTEASVARIETTSVTEENVELALAGPEENPESDLEPLPEDQSKETITEHRESQDGETSIDIRNQVIEEQIKEELKDKPETDDSINGEENTNEVTEVVILSEEVDNEVEKAGGQGIIEQVMEEESSTNELHPISKGDEANNEVEDYSAVSTERTEEVESEEHIEAQNSEVEVISSKDKQGSHVTKELDEMRLDEEFGDPLMVRCEDREEEEIEEINDASKLRQNESHIEAVTEERAATSLNEELVNTSNISSDKMNLETVEGDANQVTEVIEKVQLEEISSDVAPKVRTNDNDEVEVIKRDPDAFYMPKDHIDEAESGPTAAREADKVEETGVPETSFDNTSGRIETILKDDISSTNTLPEEKSKEPIQSSACTLLSEDEEIQKDTEIKHQVLEDSFDTKTIEEVCLPNEEQRELKAVSEEEIIAGKGLPNDEPEEQIQTTSSALPSNESKYRTGGMGEETAMNLDVVTGDEITGEQTLETNKPEETMSSPLVTMEEEENISSVKKIEEKLSEADIPDKISEDSSDATKTAETCLEKGVFQELDDATKDETAAAQALQVEESNEQSLTSELLVESLKHGDKANEDEEDEKVKEVEMLRKEKLDKEKIEGDTKDGTTLLTETIKEDNAATMVSLTEASSNSIIKETDSIKKTAHSNNGPILFDVEKESKEEITPIKVKEDRVRSSSFEYEESRNFTEEEISVAEIEETNIEEAKAEAEEEKNEIDDAVVVEENSVLQTEHEEISVCNTEIDVKSMDSYITTEDTEIPEEEGAMQDKVRNARSGDQLEMATKEITLKEILRYEGEDHEATLSEERKIYDETSEKDEHSETRLSQAMDEKLIQNDNIPQLDVLKVDPEGTENETGHEVKEQLTEEPSVEVTNVSAEEEHIELENQTDACEARTLQGEKSSDLGQEIEKIEDGTPLDEATDLGETLGTCKDDDEKAMEEENLDKNLEKPESLKEDTEIVKEDQIPEMVIINDNPKVEDYSSVSTECLKEAESEEQIVAKNLQVEEHSTNDREASHVTKELEETRQDEELRDPVSVDSVDREAEEKTEEITDVSIMSHYERCIEDVTEVSAETSLNDTNEIVTALNIRSIETSQENIESDAKQETEVENVQLEEMSSELDPDVQTNDNGVDAALQQEPLKEDEALVVNDIDNASSQTEKPEEQIQNPAVRLPSEEHRHETINDVDKTGEMKDGESDGGKTVEAKTTEKDEMREPESMLQGETNTSHIIAEESEEHGAVVEENKIKEAEPFEDGKPPQSEDGANAVHTFPENETKETELPEDKSPNIQEQTREIEEASNFNETCEKAFDNELLTETADAPNEKEIVTARDETGGEENRCEKTNEGDQITVNEVSNEEVMEDKEVTETSYSTSRSEEMIEDGSGEDGQKDKLIKDNTYEENVELALAGFKEKPESDSEVVAEERIKETLPELTNDQDDETSIDVRNQETEEPVKEELKNELKDEDSVNKEENTNKATKAAILSEVDDSEDIEENVIEEESSTNELHPVSRGDEVTNEMEDYSAVSTECIKEAKSVEQIEVENSEFVNTSNISSVKMSLENIENDTNQETKEVEKVQLEEISSDLAPEVSTNKNDEAEVIDRDIEAFYTPKSQIAEAENGPTAELEANDVKETEGEPETSADYTSDRVETTLKNDISSTKTSPEETPDEELQSSICRLLSGDEHIRIENPVEKIEEEIQNDAEIKHETREDPSETKRIEDACFPSEEQRELKAISKEETIADQGLPNDETEEKVQTKSSTLPSAESEQGSGAISEEITLEQTLESNEPEEGTTVSPLVPKEMEEENICTVEKTKEKLNEADMIPDKISEDSSDAKKTAETNSEKEAVKALEDGMKDEATAAQASEVEESSEQSLTSELTAENIKHGAMANDEEYEEVKMREREMCLEQEGPQKLEVVVDQETIVSWTSISHEIEGIGIVEKIDEEKRKEEKLDNANREGSSAGVTEELNELQLVTKEDITSSDQIFPEEQLHISTSPITSEELEHGPKETKDEKISEGEITKDEIVEDASDVSTTVETCSPKGSFVVLEVVAEDEMTAHMAEKTERENIDEAEFLQDDNREDATLQKEMLHEDEAPAVEEQIPNPVLELTSEEQKLETINEDHMTGKEIESGDFDAVKPVEEISTEKDEIKEAEPVLEGETSHLHITTSALPSEVRGDETNESESKEDESPEKIREKTGEIGEASNFKTDTCEKALDNELSIETDDGANKENLVKARDGSGGEENQCEKTNDRIDITLNEVSTEKVIKSKEVTETSCSTSCSEELRKDGSQEDEVKDKPIEGKTYEEDGEPELAGFEENVESDSKPVAEDQSKETIPGDTKSQDDETSIDVWNQKTGEQIITEELKDNSKDEDYIKREENANEVTKAVILSEKVDKEVEKIDGSEDIEEKVMEKESSTNELHPVPIGEEADIEVEDESSVSTECIKEAESEEQIEAENSEVEGNPTNDKEVSHITKQLEERSLAVESNDSVIVHVEHREAEEKDEITDDLKVGHDESRIEAATKVRAETILNDAEVNEELVNTSNISSTKMSLDTIESDANQETAEVEKVQLEEISSNLAPKVPINDNDEVEAIRRDPEVFYMHKDKVENCSTVQPEADKVEETEVPETSSDFTSPRIATIIIDDISSTNTPPEEKLQSSACALLSEDEEIGIAKPVEKIEEEIRNDAKTTEELCLPNEAQIELKAVEEDTTADRGLPNDEPEEQIQTTSSTFPSEERDLDVSKRNEVTGEQNHETSSPLVSMEDEEIVSSIEKIEEGKRNEVAIPSKTSEDFSVAGKTPEICFEKEEFQELDDGKKEETPAAQTLQLEESNEQSLILESPVENPNHGAGANDEVEEKVEEVEILEEESPREPKAVVNQEPVVAQASITKESQNIEAIDTAEKLDEEKMKEAEKLDNGNREDSSAEETEKLNELHLVTKEEITSGQSFPVQQLHISASAITSEVLEHETKETEDVETSEGEVIKDETKEDASDARKTVEAYSHMEKSVELEAVAEYKMTAGTTENVESEKTEDAEFLNVMELKEDESHEKIREETGEIEEASNFNMEIHEKAFDNELLNETEDAAIKENLVKARDGSGCEENQCEKTNGGNEIILSEVSKNVASYSPSHLEDQTKDGSGEDAVKDELIEDNTYEELIVEAQKTSENKIIEKQMEDRVVKDQGLASVVLIKTTTESGTEISAAEGNEILDHIQQTEETTKTTSDLQIPMELDPIENTGITSSVAKEHVSIDLQDRVAEYSQKAEVGDVREIYPGVECGGEKTGEEVTEGYILVEDSTKLSSYDPLESFTKETLQVTRGMIEREVKDETNASQIPLVEKPEKKSPAPVDDVEKKELKEVETQEKYFSDTKTRGEICYDKEENKELEAVVEQETVAIQAPQTKIKKDPVSHLEDSSKEDEHTGDKTDETLKITTCEIQNEKHDANDNIKTVAEDETVKDDMNEATIVKEEIPGKEDPIECKKTTNSTGKQQLPTEQQEEALETSDKAVVGDFKPGNAKEICSEAGADNGEEKRPDNLGAEKSEEPESADSAKLSLYDLLQRSTRKTIQGTQNVIEDRELIVSHEQAPEEEAKADEEEGDEHSKTESGTKPHKKSHNILSGVGSKVKQSISKVKKAITGKSSHSKEPKPISPKESKK